MKAPRPSSNLEERKGLKEAQHAAHSHPPRTYRAISASLEGSHRYPRLRPASPPRLRVADLPSSGQLISASLEATPWRIGQTALPLTRPTYGGIKGQSLLHSAQERRRQAAIPHNGCDQGPIRQLRSLLRHPGCCGSTVEPATRDKIGSTLFPSLFCQLRLSGLYLITRMAPGPPPAWEGVRRCRVPLQRGALSTRRRSPGPPPSRVPGPPRVSRTS